MTTPTRFDKPSDVPLRHASSRSRVERQCLRLVTYNIHKGIGGIDRRYRPDRIVDVLDHCNADLIFLQEVDEDVPRSRRDRQVDLLGDALGFEHRSYFPNVRLRRGHYGNALLSRFPIDHQENIDLTIALKKRRGALHARIGLETPAGARRLWLFNVHLGLAEFERRRQIRRILQWQHRHRLSHQVVAIVAGDFNDVWGRLGRQLLEPEGYQGSQKGIFTFPAVRPLRPLDRVFVRGPVSIQRSHRCRLALSRFASDHVPLIDDLVLE